MTKASNKACHSNPEWMGREHCHECHFRQLKIFSELPDSAFENILEHIDHFLYPADSVIYQAGTNKQHIYLIRHGIVKLIRMTPDGTYRILRLLGPGSAMGLELLDGVDHYHHTAITIKQVELCKIPVTAILQLEDSYPTFYHSIGQQLQEQLNLADQWIVAIGTGHAKQRVARLLLILNEFFSDDDSAFILLSREDMAAMIGITVETVSRTIAEFKRQGILLKSKGSLYTCDAATLERITCSNIEFSQTHL